MIGKRKPAKTEDSAQISDDQAPAARTVAPGFKRNMLIIGAVAALAVVIMVVLLTRASGSGKQPSAGAANLEMGVGQASRADNMSPEMKRKLEEKQREEAAAAATQNKSYVPPDPPVVMHPVQPGGAGQSALALGSAPVTRYAQSTANEADARRREGLTRQLAMLVDPPSEGGVRQSVNAQASAASGTATTASSAPSGSASAPRDSNRRTLIPGLEIVAGVLSSDLKIPDGSTGFASARIVSGPAKGGYLVGQARVLGEGLSITFTQMRLGNRVYAVDAIALDETTASNAVSANVDHRILQRYVFPVVLAAAQGFYNALAQTGSTVVDVGWGEAGVATPAPTTEQARSAGAAAALSTAQSATQKAAAAPIVVSRETNYPIGLLFRSPVYEDGAK